MYLWALTVSLSGWKSTSSLRFQLLPPLLVLSPSLSGAWRGLLYNKQELRFQSPLQLSVLSFSKLKSTLVCESSGTFKCLEQKSTVLTWDQLIPSRDWWPQRKPWVSNQGGPEKDREGQAYMTGSDHSSVWRGGTATVRGSKAWDQCQLGPFLSV